MYRTHILAGAAALALVATPALAEAPEWVTSPKQTYDVSAVELDGIIGEISVEVSDGGPVTFTVAGPERLVKATKAEVKSGKLVVSGERASGSVWNWREWFNIDIRKQDESVSVHMTVPRGTALEIDGFIGEGMIGSTEGRFELGATAASVKVGKVGAASIEMAGSGEVKIEEVAGRFTLEIAGSGDVEVGPSHSAEVEIAGSGEARLGAVAGGLTVEIAGSGDVTVASVNGPTRVSVAGAGSVEILGGEANPLSVKILGSGDFRLDGEAVDPSVSVFGSGDVKLKSYRGKLETEGNADLEIGG